MERKRRQRERAASFQVTHPPLALGHRHIDRSVIPESSEISPDIFAFLYCDLGLIRGAPVVDRYICVITGPQAYKVTFV